MFRTLTAKKLADGVVDQINAAIERGAYRPGDRLLSEHEMMKAFGVGRTTVREALLRLQQQGLIEIQHGRRARVAERPLRLIRHIRLSVIGAETSRGCESADPCQR